MLDVTNTKTKISDQNKISIQCFEMNKISIQCFEINKICVNFLSNLSIYHHQISFKRLFNKKSIYILYTIHCRYTLQYLNASRVKQLFDFALFFDGRKYMANQHIHLFIRLWVSNVISMYSFNFFLERVLFQKWEEMTSMIINVLMKETSTVVKIKW